MVRTNIFQPTEVREVTESLGNFSVLEYKKDISVSPSSAQTSYFMAKMGMHKRQVICRLNGNGVLLQAGAMQIITGDVNVATNVKGAGDFFKKVVGGKVTGESAIKPRYTGNGIVYLEPTYKYIILQDLAEWNGAMTIEDGMFLACDDTVEMKVTARSTLSSAALGGEGLFNTTLTGRGVAVLESRVPYGELLVYDLENDTIKIDGNMAIAWSAGLQFTVERTTATLIGSAASGEGLVNVYRGTGRILVAPV
ncbi:MAG: AIM24 family protein [Ruminococcus sp.]|nr:AIM24 family protein [Ruminococcus sp.]